jgi:hypothetical protein
MSEKSILEQALLQVQTLEEAVKHNAKGILASTMKQELSDLLKESMEEEEEVNPMGEAAPKEEEKDDMSDEEETTADDEEADDTSDDENVDNLDNDNEDSKDDETSKDIDGLDSEDGEESDETSMDDLNTDSEPDTNMGSDDDDVMDMTGASDDEVLKVFKAMKPEDGIVVKKDGNTVEFGDGEDEYIIKLDDEGNEIEEEAPMEEENLYEIELDEDEDAPYEKEVHEDEDAPYEKKVSVKSGVHESKDGPFEKKVKVKKDVHEDENAPFEKKAKVKKDVHEDENEPYEKEVHEDENAPFEKKAGVKKIEASEAARTKSNIHGDKNGMDRAGLKSKTKYKAGSGSINEEVETLKKQNAEYKKALVLFKDKLNEVAVFNANLAYATRLFTEHSTTKQEKLNILKRFDSVSTLNESKGLYSAIAAELGNKTTVTESVATKISNTPSSSSTEVLSEAKAYENPQFARMKDLMKKIK